jgi:hypothetical protein
MILTMMLQGVKGATSNERLMGCLCHSLFAPASQNVDGVSSTLPAEWLSSVKSKP